MLRRDRPDGSGDLIFEEIVSTHLRVIGRGFQNVERVREVEALVRATLLCGG
jgi:hypothetical protein